MISYHLNVFIIPCSILSPYMPSSFFACMWNVFVGYLRFHSFFIFIEMVDNKSDFFIKKKYWKVKIEKGMISFFAPDLPWIDRSIDWLIDCTLGFYAVSAKFQPYNDRDLPWKFSILKIFLIPDSCLRLIFLYWNRYFWFIHVLWVHGRLLIIMYKKNNERVCWVSIITFARKLNTFN